MLIDQARATVRRPITCSLWLALSLLSACATTREPQEPKPTTQVERLKERAAKQRADEKDRADREAFINRNKP